MSWGDERGLVHRFFAVSGHHGVQKVVLGRERAALKQILGRVREGSVAQKRSQHGDRLIREPLLHEVLHLPCEPLLLLAHLPAGVVDEGGELEVGLAPADPQ